MTANLPLFPDDPRTGPRPPFLCAYEPECRPAPVAEFSAPERYGMAENVNVRCLNCGRTGIISTRTDLDRGTRG